MTIDISQFRKGIEEINGTVYKSEGNVHSYSDGQYHEKGEKVLWARDNPIADTWDHGKWRDYFIFFSTDYVIDEDPFVWKNNTGFNENFYFDFTEAAIKMLNNGYKGDFSENYGSGTARRHALWSSNDQEEEWRKACVDMWAPWSFDRTDNDGNPYVQWNNEFDKIKKHCRFYPDYFPMQNGYEIDDDEVVDPDSLLNID